MAFMRVPLYILMQDGKVLVSDGPGVAGFNAFGQWPQALFDEIVMMRYYNMTEVERREIIDRVLKTQFETGADGLRKASGLPTVMDRAVAELKRAQETGEFFEPPRRVGK